MKLLIRDISAIGLWDRGLASRVQPAQDDELHGFTLSARERSAIDPARYGAGVPLQLLSLGDGFHAVSRNWAYQSWGKPVPPGSIMRATEEIYVASPEFCFLRMAPELGFYDAVKLGMEMCGYYSTLVQQGQGYRKRPPLTTSQKLLNYLLQAVKPSSKSIALRAAKHIQDGSASPGETASHMELCLPFRYGCFGFEHPLLNEPIPLSPEERIAAGRSEFRVDLYWPEFRLAGEYLGKESHEGEFNVQRDVIRRNILESKGIEVVEISHAMLVDPDQMMVAVERIAKRMGRRLRLPADGFWEKQAEARSCIMQGGRCTWLP